MTRGNTLNRYSYVLRELSIRPCSRKGRDKFLKWSSDLKLQRKIPRTVVLSTGWRMVERVDRPAAIGRGHAERGTPGMWTECGRPVDPRPRYAQCACVKTPVLNERGVFSVYYFIRKYISNIYYIIYYTIRVYNSNIKIRNIIFDRCE